MSKLIILLRIGIQNSLFWLSQLIKVPCSVLKCILIICCFVTTVQAQEQHSLVNKANELFIKQEYALAAKLFEKIVAKDKLNLAAYRKLARCYLEINQYDAAEKNYGYIVDYLNPDPLDFFYLAEMQKSQGKYMEAKSIYQRYQQKTGIDMSAKMDGCDSALVWLEQPAKYAIQNVQILNSSAADWGATISSNDGRIAFVSDSLRKELKSGFSFFKESRTYGRTANEYQKIYRADSLISGGIRISDFSTKINGAHFHTGPIVFNNSFDTAYYTVTYTGDNALKTEAAESKLLTKTLKTRTLELYITTKNFTDGWQKGIPFLYNKPNAYSIGHAALSNNGQILYFTSDMPGGIGGLDIWYCEKKSDGQWGIPTNCGFLINTSADEAFPTIAKDGNLYFASKGLVGMGGYDIYIATGDRNQWTIPQNLGSPINSPADDFYMTFTNAYSGFFASNRKGGKGNDDIYAFKSLLHTPMYAGKMILETTVQEKIARTPIAKAQVTLQCDKDLLARDSTSILGKAYSAVADRIPCTVTVAKEGYQTYQEVLKIPVGTKLDTVKLLVLLGKQPLERTVPKVIPLNEVNHTTDIQVGDKIVLRNIHYDFDKANIRPDAARILDTLLVLLRKYPTMEIELSSHTDARGTDIYNLDLSDRRAKAAVEYLTKRGIGYQRMVARGYGELLPVNGCINDVPCSEAEHQDNRRTEVKITKM